MFKSYTVDGNKEILETRLLIHRERGWVALPYQWKNGAAKLNPSGDCVASDDGGRRVLHHIDRSTVVVQIEERSFVFDDRENRYVQIDQRITPRNTYCCH